MSESDDSPHVFLSYVKEDIDKAVRLQAALEAGGISVWRDKDKLWPGQDWKLEIRNAIRKDSLAFVACFSDNSKARDASVQNEELVIAIEEFRKRPPGTQWLFPLRWDEVEPPQFEIRPGQELSDLQFTDLFGEREQTDLVRLTTSLISLLKRTGKKALRPKSPVTASAAVNLDDAALAAKLKTLLRDQSADIELEELVLGIAREVRQTLQDAEHFPNSRPIQDDSAFAWSSFLVGRVDSYVTVVRPMLTIFELAGMYGRIEHERIWTRAMQFLVATTIDQTGNSLVVQYREIPILLAMYTGAIAAVSRSNWGALRAIVVDPKKPLHVGAEQKPLVAAINTWSPVSREDRIARIAVVAAEGTELTEDVAEGIFTGKIGGRLTPMADYLVHLLWPRFEDQFMSHEEFEDAFDATERMLNALSIDAGSRWVGQARSSWRARYVDPSPEKKLLDEAVAAESGWQPLSGGLFGGETFRAVAALEYLEANAKGR